MASSGPGLTIARTAALLTLSAITGACLEIGDKSGTGGISGNGLPVRQDEGSVEPGPTQTGTTVTVTMSAQRPAVLIALPSTSVIPVAPTSTQPPSRTAEGLPAPANGDETPVPAEERQERTLRRYRMHESGGEVVALQMILGLKSVDGIYGPVTRAAHMNYLGGPEVALRIFYPDLAHAGGAPATGPLPTLGELIDRFFLEPDRDWAHRVAFCESSGQTHHSESSEVSAALASGWFQHLAKYWVERSTAAGWEGYGIFHGEANVAVAAWLLYEGGGPRHWNPSRTCWEE